MTVKKFLAKDFQLAARALRDAKADEVEKFIADGLPLNVVRFDPGGDTWEKNTALGFMVDTSSKILIHESCGQDYILKTYADRDAIGMMLLDAGADPAQTLYPNGLSRRARIAEMSCTADRLEEMGY